MKLGKAVQRGSQFCIEIEDDNGELHEFCFGADLPPQQCLDEAKLLVMERQAKQAEPDPVETPLAVDLNATYVPPPFVPSPAPEPTPPPPATTKLCQFCLFTVPAAATRCGHCTSLLT